MGDTSPRSRPRARRRSVRPFARGHSSSQRSPVARRRLAAALCYLSRIRRARSTTRARRLSRTNSGMRRFRRDGVSRSSAEPPARAALIARSYTASGPAGVPRSASRSRAFLRSVIARHQLRSKDPSAACRSSARRSLRATELRSDFGIRPVLHLGQIQHRPRPWRQRPQDREIRWVARQVRLGLAHQQGQRTSTSSEGAAIVRGEVQHGPPQIRQRVIQLTQRAQPQRPLQCILDQVIRFDVGRSHDCREPTQRVDQLPTTTASRSAVSSRTGRRTRAKNCTAPYHTGTSLFVTAKERHFRWPHQIDVSRLRTRSCDRNIASCQYL